MIYILPKLSKPCRADCTDCLHLHRGNVINYLVCCMMINKGITFWVSFTQF
uniref:Uncharacterized protein n=1 Tax=Rhizophora mucronata TaxID=61149 RepID=A0A2P2PMD8_RHIMU